MSRRSRRAKDHDVALAADGSLPVDGSWRMVDGEHDSFDTSILPSVGPDDDYDDVLMPLSSGQPSSGFPSQLSSQGGAGSQDSIRDFAKHQDDEQVILREPFRPSMVVTTSGGGLGRVAYRTPGSAV